jgi:hypothetical protein
VPRTVTLVALWVVFAVASVSVGFAAAGLVSDPFTDVGTADAASVAGPGARVTVPDSTPSASAGGQSSTPTPSGSATTTPADPTKPSTNPSANPSSGSSTVKGGITTKGGYVSGTCRDGLVSVGAAPALWWKVDSATSGRVRTARVRLEPSKDANGERVDVTASCVGGNPVFHTDYNDGGGGSGGSGSGSDGSGSGSSDSGSSGSGSSGSSGSGSGDSGSGGSGSDDGGGSSGSGGG